jgi:hypothetical protein
MKQKQTWPHLQFNCCLKTGFFDKDTMEKHAMPNKKQLNPNRHRTRPRSSQNGRPIEIEPNFAATKLINEYSVYRVGSKSACKKVAFFPNSLPASKISELEKIGIFANEGTGKRIRTKIIDQTGISFKSEQHSELFKNSNLYEFDGVFCDHNIRSSLYSKTFEQTIQRVFSGQKTTALIIGERETRRKSRFFLSGTSIFKKFQADLQSKFEIFQRGEEAECLLNTRVSVFGLFGNRVFDFLKGGEKNESVKISKLSLNSRPETDEFLDKLKATFNVCKTLAYKQKSIILVVKLFITIRDKVTGIKLRTSNVNFVIADCTHFDKELLGDVKDSLVQGSSPMSESSKKHMTNICFDKKDQIRNLNDSNKKTLVSIFTADAINVYLCLNASFKNSDVNKKLLELNKEILNEIKMTRSLARDTIETKGMNGESSQGDLVNSRKSNMTGISNQKLLSNLEFIERTIKSLEDQITHIPNLSQLSSNNTRFAHIINMLQMVNYEFNEMRSQMNPKIAKDLQARLVLLNERLSFGQTLNTDSRFFNQT